MYKTQDESRGVTTASKAHHQDVQHSSEGNSKKKIYLLQKRQQLEQQAGKMDKRRKTQHTDPQRVGASENLPSTKPTSELKLTEIKQWKLDDWTDQKRKGKETTQLYSCSEGHTVQTAAAATGDGKRDTSCSLSHTFINQSQCTWGEN